MNEEAWVYSVVKDYEYCLEKYPEKVKEFSSVRKQWQGLTAKEFDWILNGNRGARAFIKVTESILKDKNK